MWETMRLMTSLGRALPTLKSCDRGPMEGDQMCLFSAARHAHAHTYTYTCPFVASGVFIPTPSADKESQTPLHPAV